MTKVGMLVLCIILTLRIWESKAFLNVLRHCCLIYILRLSKARNKWKETGASRKVTTIGAKNTSRAGTCFDISGLSLPCDTQVSQIRARLYSSFIAS
ncbi:hypothetical protein BT69DRAFT_774167 [Atractiella rhizophila]|nr:hypothetical protein BT69DRAFT_774167 [Atractiella rhizophila]